MLASVEDDSMKQRNYKSARKRFFHNLKFFSVNFELIKTAANNPLKSYEVFQK